MTYAVPCCSATPSGARVIIYLMGALSFSAFRLVLVALPASSRRPERPAAKPAFSRRERPCSSLLPASLREPALERLRNHFGSEDYRAAKGVMRECLVKSINLD